MIGKTISHYRILEKLGEGGMGVVCKAEDTDLQRHVALKFLTPQSLGSEEEVARFVHEARSAAALDHPNICTVYEIGKAEDRTFIAMAYIEGRSLKDKIEAGPMRIGEAVELAIQIAEGLSKAHEKDIVHRDIKPANIMVTSEGQAKIMDFGLAKSAKRTVLTQEGTTLGTVAYLSPEQARGEDVNGRTDIWSLGAVLYEMVTGQRPFKGDYEPAVIYSILNQEQEPMTALRTGVPMEVERIANKCLAKDKGERYQTAADLVADLRHLKRSLTETVAQSRQAVPLEAGRKSIRPWLWAFVVVAAVILAVALTRHYVGRSADETVGLEPGETVSERKMLVVLPFENLGPPENAYFADGMTEEITTRLACVKALGVISRTSAVQYDRTGKTIKNIGEDLGVDYVLEGTVRWDGTMSDESRVRVTPQLIRVADDTHLWANSYDRQLQDIFSVQSDIAAQVVDQMGVTLLDPERGAIEVRPTQNIDAYHAYLRGLKMREGVDPLIRNMEAAQRMFEEAVSLDPGFAQAYAELSKVHSSYRHFGLDRSPERRRLAEKAALKALELAPKLPEPHMAMGYYYYWGLQEYDKALREFSLAKGIRPNDPGIVEAEGLILRRKGNLDEAIERFRRALTLSPRDPDLLFELGNTLQAVRRYEEAQDYYKQSIALAPSQMLSYGGLAEIELRWSGDLREARRWLEQMGTSNRLVNSYFWLPQQKMERDYEAALATIDSTDMPSSLAMWNYFSKPLMKAGIYDLMGETETARAYYDSARILFEGTLEEDPERHELHVVLASAYAGLDRKDDAMSQVEKAIELDPITNDAYDRSYLFSLIAEVYVRLGEYDMAIDQIEYLLAAPNGLTPALLRLEQRWGPLRDHPRFKRLLEGSE